MAPGNAEFEVQQKTIETSGPKNRDAQLSADMLAKAGDAGAAKAVTPNQGGYCNTPNGQELKG